MRSFKDLLDTASVNEETKLRFARGMKYLQHQLKEKECDLDEAIANFCAKFFDRDDEKQFPVIIEDFKKHFQSCMDNANIKIRNQNLQNVAEEINSVIVAIDAFDKRMNMGIDSKKEFVKANPDITETFETNKLTLRDNLFSNLKEHCELMKTLIEENSKSTDDIIRKKFDVIIQKWIESLPEFAQIYLV